MLPLADPATPSTMSPSMGDESRSEWTSSSVDSDEGPPVGITWNARKSLSSDVATGTTAATSSWLAIALLTAIYKTGRHGTMAEVLIALEVIDSNLEGKPHSMKSLSSKLGIPYTSVSRIVYSLTAEAQPGGVLKLVPDSKDRRRKHIELDTDALKRMSSHVRALEKAMIDYYGASVYKLKKDQPN